MYLNKREKLKSRTFWLAVFCGIVSAVWGTMSLIMRFDPPWLSGSIPALIGVVIAYVGGNKLVASKGDKCGNTDQG